MRDKSFRYIQTLLVVILTLFTTSLLTAVNVTAQSNLTEQTLKPGDKLLKTALLVPGGETRTEQFISYILTKGKQQNFSFLTRTLEIVRTQNAEDVFRVTQRYEDGNGTNVDVSETLPKTLMPISYRAELTSQTEEFSFLSGSVKGNVTQKTGAVKNHDVPLEEPVYNAVILTELIQSLPLTRNYVAKFRVYNPGKSFIAMNLRVTGEDRISVAGGATIKAWIVRIEGGYAPVTVWIAKNTQELIKQKVELKNGDEFWRIRLY